MSTKRSRSGSSVRNYRTPIVAILDSCTLQFVNDERPSRWSIRGLTDKCHRTEPVTSALDKITTFPSLSVFIYASAYTRPISQSSRLEISAVAQMQNYRRRDITLQESLRTKKTLLTAVIVINSRYTIDYARSHIMTRWCTSASALYIANVFVKLPGHRLSAHPAHLWHMGLISLSPLLSRLRSDKGELLRVVAEKKKRERRRKKRAHSVSPIILWKGGTWRNCCNRGVQKIGNDFRATQKFCVSGDNERAAGRAINYFARYTPIYAALSSRMRDDIYAPRYSRGRCNERKHKKHTGCWKWKKHL